MNDPIPVAVSISPCCRRTSNAFRTVSTDTPVASAIDCVVAQRLARTLCTHCKRRTIISAGVLCDLDLLATLPTRELVSGLAEVVKCGFIADPRILEIIEADPAAAVTAGNPAEHELIERSVRVKADVVGVDLTEQI